MNIPSEPQDFLFKQCEALKRVVSELRSRLAVADQELSRRNIELDRLNAAFQVKTEELAASEERFKSLVMTIPDIVYRLDRQGNFVWVTSNVQTLGYAPDNLAGRHFSEIVYPDDLFTVSRFDMLQQYRGHKTGCSHAAKLFDERRTGGRGTRGLEIRLMCAGPDPIESGPISDFSQSIVRVEINSAGIYDAGGIYSGTFGVMRVVSERKAMEKALAESRRRLQILLDHTEAGIMLIDERSRTIADVNAAAEKMIGALRKDLIGRECYGFVCALERGQCPILDLGQTLDNRVSVLIHSGKTEIPILKTAVRVEFDNQPYLFESFLDISALKRTDSELRKARIELEAGVAKRTAELLKINRKLEEKVSAHVQANSELEKILREMKQSREKIIHSENMSAVGVLAAGVAHELNNPMMGILNYIQYCLNKMNPDERLFGVLKDAEQEVGRCVQIVGNLMTFARERPVDKCPDESADLAEILERTFRLMDFRIQKERVALIRKIESGLPAIRTYAEAVDMMLLNLIGNAIDAVKECEQRIITVEIGRRDRCIQIVIADSGKGILPEHRSRIFDPFFTTKPLGLGTGLGLPVCRNLAESIGGSIDCESEPGHGARFIVSLPMNAESTMNCHAGEQIDE